jgi:cytochrome c oxidase subunit II
VKRGLPAAAALLASGCGGTQSVLDPANPAAREVERLWWISFASTGVLSLVVLGGLFWAVARARRAHGDPGRNVELPASPARALEDRWILLLGGGLPALFLVGFLVVAVRTGMSVAEPPSEPALTVEVTGHMFWWEITYPELGFVTANELRIPVGVPVQVKVTSADVIHSFWVPGISPGKVDMVPGRTNRIWVLAEEPGRYRGQCTEFCGVQHALMSMLVIALEPDAFEAWTRARSRPLASPEGPELERGLAVFFEAGCAACHSFDGRIRSAGSGFAGPDLFDLRNRSTLGALTIENTPENLADWIIDPNAFKPGVRMPGHRLEYADLSALLAYLESLGR